MIDLMRKNQERRFREALEGLPQRGEGLHAAILGVANLGVAAGLSEDEIVEAISAADRAFKTGEIEDAVVKALDDAEDQANGILRASKSHPHAPMTKAAAAGRILAEDKERAAQLQAALIEKGGRSIDPFDEKIRAMSSPQFELVSPIAGISGSEHRRDMLPFLKNIFDPGDSLYIGNGMETKYFQREHIKTVAEWIVFFEHELDAIENEPDPREQQRMLADLGGRYTFFVINPLSGDKNEAGSFRSNSNVKAFCHVLLESDSLPLDQQIALMQGLKLPIISMVFSGGKSIHALVDVARIPGGESVKDLAAWNTTVKRDFFGQLGPLGFDKATSNSARLSRVPGCFRADKGSFQSLIYINRNGGPLHV